MDVTDIYREFPAPSYREKQKQALRDIKDAFETGNDIVLIQAPTGSGKSLLARAIAGCADPHFDDDRPTGAYYTTPQVSQLDDVADDPLLDDLAILTGKQNFECIRDEERGVPVTEAKCSRDPDFECPELHDCPYFSQRQKTTNSDIAAMTLAYFMHTANLDIFNQRDVVVIDEAHGLGEWAEMYASIEISASTVPNWGDVGPPKIQSVGDAHAYLSELVPILDELLKDLRAKPQLEPEKAKIREHLSKLLPDLRWFLDTYEDEESTITWLVDGDVGRDGFTIKPLHPERFLKYALWERGNKFALLSATLLNKDAFCQKVGVSPADAALVEIGHTFPLENRPLYDVTDHTGEMKYEERDETIPELGKTIARIMQNHRSEKGLIHCHSYSIQERLEKHILRYTGGRRLRSHDKYNRDEQLAEWMASDDPEVFLSVKMEEALDLEGDLCRWQVLCKAPYQNTNDVIVDHRLNEEDQWGWYYRCALRTIIQACGRVVRSKDDYGATYIADENIHDVFDRAQKDIPDWFQEQIDAAQVPTLPRIAAPPE
jgi:Rad3-related DNA helicase